MLDPLEENSHCETLTSQALLTTGEVAMAHSIPETKLVVIASLLESMACLLPRKAPAPFVAAFAKLLVAHVAENKLFPGLVERFRTGVPPEWQLLVRNEETANNGAIFAVWSHAAGEPVLTLDENLGFVSYLVRHLPEILNAVGLVPKPKMESFGADFSATPLKSNYAKEPEKPKLVELASLAKLVLSDDTGDVATLCILQSARATQEILSASTIASDSADARAAKRIMGCVLERPFLVYLASRGQAPGASTIIEKCFKSESASFDLALDNSPYVISELLCHGFNFGFAEYPVLHKAVELAAERLEALAFHSLSGLYKLHNSKARSQSLLTTLCDAIYLVSRNLNIHLGESFDRVSLFQSIFTSSTLPPFPKANIYFPPGYKSAMAPEIEQLGPVMRLESLVSTIGSLFRAAQIIARHEILETSSGLGSSINNKLATYRVQKVVACVIAVMFSLYTSEGGALNALIEREGIKLLRIILLLFRKHSTDENDLEGEVFWVTLFNMANDACYGDIALAPLVLRTIDMLIKKVELVNCELLVKSALLPLYATFDDGSGTYPGTRSIIEWDKDGCRTVSVPRGEYSFLDTASGSLSLKSPDDPEVSRKKSDSRRKK